MAHHKCTLLRDSHSHLPKLLPNAPWYQKLKRRFKKLFLVSDRHPEVFQYLKSKAAIEKESMRQVNLAYFVIHPLSEFRKYWNIMIFFMLFLHQGMTAFSIGFFVELEYDAIEALIFIDVIICSFLFLEILLTLRTGVIVFETNEIILNPWNILKMIRKNIFIDILNALPYIYLTTYMTDVENTIVNGTVILYMVYLMLYNCYYFNRMLFYFSTFPLILDLSEKSSIILMICLRSIFLLHWATCMRRLVPLYIDQQDLYGDKQLTDFKDFNEPTKYFMEVIKIQELEENLDKFETILVGELDEIFKNYTMFHKYSRSMLITLRTATQAGFGYETSDSIMIMLMSTFIMVGGWIYTTYVMVYIFNIIVASAISENKFEEMMREIEAFCDSKNLSEALHDRIKTFLKRKFQKHYFNEEAIKQSTPKCLQKEIMMHKCSHLVARVPLFKDMPPLLLEKIISCLQFEIYFPGDIIIEANAMGDSMFFIAYGTAAIITKTGQRLQTVSDGAHFGEISLLMKGQKRTATVKALEICEVYKLSQRDFIKVIEPHRDIVRRMEEIAHQRIRKTFQNQQLRFSFPSSD